MYLAVTFLFNILQHIRGILALCVVFLFLHIDLRVEKF